MAALAIVSLGQFQIWRNQSPIPPDAWPTQKSKAVVKILLSAQGALVTSDQLIEWLWAGRDPDKARNNLWVAVSQARRALEPDLPRRASSSYIVSEGEGYRWQMAGDSRWDVDDFQAGLAQAYAARDAAAQVALFEETLAYYHGDYLAEDAYAGWAMPLRERLRADMLAARLSLAEEYAGSEQYARALAQARLVLEQEPANETAYRAFMRYAYFNGEQHTALQAYDRCVEHLRQELDVEPARETTELYRQIQRRALRTPPRAAAAPPTAPDALDAGTAVPSASAGQETIYSLTHPPLVGRAPEYEQLRRLIHRVQTQGATQGGQVILIEGEPGIGKSRIVQEAIGHAQSRRMLTLWTHCYQVEQAIPYQPVIDMLDQAMSMAPANRFTELPAIYLAELATLAPELRELVADLPELTDDATARQARRMRALQQCLEQLGGAHGLVWAVDDVHWADHATRQFLHHLASHIIHLPVLLIYTYRPEEAAADPELDEFVGSILRMPQASRLLLRRFSAADTNTFLAQLTGLDPPGLDPRAEGSRTPGGGGAQQPHAGQLGEWLHGETEGHPFYLVSILQSLVEQELLSEERPVWRLDVARMDTSDASLTLPEAVRESVRARLRRAPPRVRRVLDLAAVLGRRFDFATLQAVSGEDGLTLLEAVEDLLRRQLLREVGDSATYDFSHDKVREVVYTDLSAARRVLLHRSVADELARAPGALRERAAILAHHYEQGQVGDKAFHYMLRAADRFRQLFAVREAAQFYDRAITLAGREPDLVDEGLRLDLYMRRGEVRALLDGYLQDAAGDLRHVVEGARAAGDGPRQTTALIALGQVYRMADELEQASDYLMAALELCRESGNRRGMAEVLHHLGTVAWSAGNNFHASIHHQEAAELARHLNREDLITVQVLHGRGEAFVAAARPLYAQALFEESLALARHIGNRRYEGENLQMIGLAGMGLAGTADYPLAQKALVESLAVSREAHVEWNTGITSCFLGWVECCLGNYGAGLVRVQRAIETLRTGGLARFLSMAYGFLGHIYQDLNFPEAALDAYAQGLHIALEADVGFWLPRLSADVAIARLRLGDGGAVRDLSVAYAVADEGYQRFHAVRCLEGLMEGGMVLDEPERTLHYAGVLETICQAGKLHELQAQVHRWRGVAWDRLGDPAQAAAELHRALTLAESIGRVRLLWEVHQALAAHYDAQDNPGQAAAQRETVAHYARLIASSLPDPTLHAGLPVAQTA